MNTSAYGSDRGVTSRSDAEIPGIRSPHWHRWQRTVLRRLRAELREVVVSMRLEDVDWCSWSVLYLQGRSARSAVQWALERDIWRSIRRPPYGNPPIAGCLAAGRNSCESSSATKRNSMCPC